MDRATGEYANDLLNAVASAVTAVGAERAGQPIKPRLDNIIVIDVMLTIVARLGAHVWRTDVERAHFADDVRTAVLLYMKENHEQSEPGFAEKP